MTRMKHILLVLGALAALSACSTTVDFRLRGYVDEFRHYSNRYGYIWPNDMTVKFVTKLRTKSVARCVKYKNGFDQIVRRAVEIDMSDWKDFEEWQREWLVFHELFHCVVYREHLSGYSYMNPDMLYSIDGKQYYRAKGFLIEEGFTSRTVVRKSY